MYKVIYTTKCKKDVKLIKRQGKDKIKFDTIVQSLANGVVLEERYKDHNLIGDWVGCRECHIQPDWLLIYRLDKIENILYLLRTGSHADLFKESISTSLTYKQLNEVLQQYIES